MDALRKLPWLNALPAYPGGKRRLLQVLFGMIDQWRPRSTWSDATLADPFLGGGAVSLTAKRLGFSVHASDIAERSALVGRALLANNRVRLDSRWLLRNPDPVTPTHLALLQRMAPARAGYFAEARANFLVMPSGPRRDLFGLALLKLLLASFPMSLPSASDAVHSAESAFDRISPARLGHYLAKRAVSPEEVERVVAAINGAIIPGRATFCAMDALEFLPTTAADVVVLDPPYEGTQSYERAFRLVDEFLDTQPLQPSRFSRSSAPIDELLDACRHIPALVLCAGNARVSEDQWGPMVARHGRVTRVLALPVTHYGSVATARKNAVNKEILVFGERE